MAEGPLNTPDDPVRPDGEERARPGLFGGRRSLRSPRESLQPELAPPPPPSSQPPRKRRPIVSTLSGGLSFLGIAAIAAIALFSFALQRLNAPGPLPADKVIYIETGTDSAGIVEQLEREGVTDSWPLMTAALYAKTGALGFGAEKKSIKAGEYLFKQNASIDTVTDTLISGKQILHSITIPEGLTSEQIVERLNGDEALVGEVRAVPKEGTLMPDTYKFARGTKRDVILTSMQQEQSRVITEVWSHRGPDTPIKSPFEMKTLASIVEKETGRADERPRVAGVFVNRLLRNMPLQSDPTVVYGLVGGKGTLGRAILRSDLDQKTAFNTYSISGLPPTPICNPGKAAMEAVTNPSRTRDIYFVADGTGGHAFAETLDQHRANVQRWRQIEKDAKDKLTPDADKAMQINPPAGSPPKEKQRGQSGPVGSVYGVLNRTWSSQQATLAQATRNFGTADYPNLLAVEDQARDRLKSVLQPDAAALAFGSEADGEGSFGGPANPSAMSAEEAALAYAGGPGSTMTFPVSAARLADEKAAAAQFGLPPGSDRQPREELISTDPGAAAVRGPQTASRRPRAFDASEGTALDPLRDRSYDLNSAKTVPVMLTGPIGRTAPSR